MALSAQFWLYRAFINYVEVKKIEMNEKVENVTLCLEYAKQSYYNKLRFSLMIVWETV